MDNKIPQYKTKSFWFTLGTYIVSGLVLTGVLAPSQEGQAGDMTHQIVQAVSLTATFFSSMFYANKLKKEAVTNAVEKAKSNSNRLPQKPAGTKPTPKKRKPRRKKPE